MSDLKFYDAKENAKAFKLPAWFFGVWWFMGLGSTLNADSFIWMAVWFIVDVGLGYLTILCILEYKRWKRMILVDELLSEETAKS